MTKKRRTSKKPFSKKAPTKKNLPKTKPLEETVSVEEKKLFAKIKRGNTAARNEILGKYSIWATNIARKYHALFPNIDILELEAEGNRGLLEAVARFDLSKHTKFSTYAWFWIIKNVQQYITSSINLIGVPARIMSDLKMIISAMNDGIKKGEDLSLKDISKKLGLDEGAVNEMLSDRKNVSAPLSLDMFLDEENRQEKLGDVLEDKKLDSVRKILDKMDEKKFIDLLFAQLSPIEQKVISLRFGFKGEKALTLNEAGQILKLPPLKVKDIEAIVLMKLKRLASDLSSEQDKEDYINKHQD